MCVLLNLLSHLHKNILCLYYLHLLCVKIHVESCRANKPRLNQTLYGNERFSGQKWSQRPSRHNFIPSLTWLQWTFLFFLLLPTPPSPIRLMNTFGHKCWVPCSLAVPLTETKLMVCSACNISFQSASFCFR